MLKQNLQQKLLQKLSPQQIQLIKLLELPTLQLEQRIKRELEENPILEEGRTAEDEPSGSDEHKEEDYDNNDFSDDFTTDDYSRDDFSAEEYINESELNGYKLHVNNYSKDDKVTDVPYSEGISLHEHLVQQLGLQKLNELQFKIALYIIGNIDDSGYLRRELESISDDLALKANVNATEAELKYLLKVIQRFDPPGIGTTDLRECLMIQIERKLEDSPENKELLKIAYKVLDEYFEEFSKKHFTKITQRMNMSEDKLKHVVELILKLSPKPGTLYSGQLSQTSQEITPDFVLEIIEGEPVVSLNAGNVPDLRVSRTYAEMLKGYQETGDRPSREEKNAIAFVKQKLDSAKWFIDAIKQRQNTLLQTMESIVDYQREYFKDGDETELRPMILKDIADRTQLDISTISRVANSKYIQTHFGIFPLKYFFSEGMETQDGDTVSTREIKRILQECIDNEDKRRPLTDERLAQILQEKGYLIARRTVAKYREQLDILVARLRKEL